MDTRNAAPSGQFDRQTTVKKILWYMELQMKMSPSHTLEQIIAEEISALDEYDVRATFQPAEGDMASTSSDGTVPQVSSLPQVEVEPIDESFFGVQVGRNAQINSNVNNGPGYSGSVDSTFSGVTLGDGAVINSGSNNGLAVPIPTPFPGQQTFYAPAQQETFRWKFGRP